MRSNILLGLVAVVIFMAQAHAAPAVTHAFSLDIFSALSSWISNIFGSTTIAPAAFTSTSSCTNVSISTQAAYTTKIMNCTWSGGNAYFNIGIGQMSYVTYSLINTGSGASYASGTWTSSNAKNGGSSCIAAVSLSGLPSGGYRFTLTTGASQYEPCGPSSFESLSAVTSSTTASTTTTVPQTRYYLSMSPSGCVTPVSGFYAAGSRVNISASRTCTGGAFQSWGGSGSGSYTGVSQSAAITMYSNTSQIAVYEGTTTTTIPQSNSTCLSLNASTTAPGVSFQKTCYWAGGNVFLAAGVGQTGGVSYTVTGESDGKAYWTGSYSFGQHNTSGWGAGCMTNSTTYLPAQYYIVTITSGSSAYNPCGYHVFLSFNNVTAATTTTVPPTNSTAFPNPYNYTYTGLFNASSSKTLSWVPNNSLYFSDTKYVGVLTNFQTNNPYYSCLVGQTLYVYTAQSEYPGKYVIHGGISSSACNNARYITLTLPLNVSGGGGGGGGSGAGCNNLTTVYVGHNDTCSPFTVLLMDLGQPNGNGISPAYINVLVGGSVTNVSMVWPHQTAYFTVGGKTLNLFVNNTFAGLYAYQRWAQMSMSVNTSSGTTFPNPYNYTYYGQINGGTQQSLNWVPNNSLYFNDTRYIGYVSNFQTNNPYYSCLDGSTLYMYKAQSEYPNVTVVHGGVSSQSCTRYITLLYTGSVNLTTSTIVWNTTTIRYNGTTSVTSSTTTVPHNATTTVILGNSCVTQSGYLCAGLSYTPGVVGFTFGQDLGFTFYNASFACSQSQNSTPSTLYYRASTLVSGQTLGIANLTCNALLIPGGYKGYLWIKYNTQSSNTPVLTDFATFTYPGAGSTTTVGGTTTVITIHPTPISGGVGGGISSMIQTVREAILNLFGLH